MDQNKPGLDNFININYIYKSDKMTDNQHKTTTTTREATPKSGCGLKRVMNDEEMEKYLEGEPDYVCRYIRFLNSIRKGHVNIMVFNDDSVVIETDGDELELTNLFERYFEE